VRDIRAAREIAPIATVPNRYSLADRGSEAVLEFCETEGLLFISPWDFGYQSLTPMNFAAWVIGVLAVIAGGWVLLDRPGEMRPQGGRPA
jgi:hypothetical protein